MWFPFVTVGSSNRVNTSDKQHVSTWPPTSPRRRLFSFLFGFRSLAFPISYSRYGGFLVLRCIYTFLGGKGEKTRAHLLWVTAHWSHEAARLLNCITPHVAFSLGKCSSSSSLLFFFPPFNSVKYFCWRVVFSAGNGALVRIHLRLDKSCPGCSQTSTGNIHHYLSTKNVDSKANELSGCVDGE